MFATLRGGIREWCSTIHPQLCWECALWFHLGRDVFHSAGRKLVADGAYSVKLRLLIAVCYQIWMWLNNCSSQPHWFCLVEA